MLSPTQQIVDPSQEFSFELPPELIATQPAEPRDHSKLMVIKRSSRSWEHQHFYDISHHLGKNDVLVRNNSKVIPARLFGKKLTGGKVELLLVKPIQTDQASSCVWECLTKPGLRPKQTVNFSGLDHPLEAECVDQKEITRYVKFNLNNQDFLKAIDRIGHTPLPPYIKSTINSETAIRQSYQTKYAKELGSVAAPTAGLHFTAELDDKLRANGVEIVETTLHVGLGTFLPLQPEQIQSRLLHSEQIFLSPNAANQLNQAKLSGKRIIAVGTTTTRLLESCATVLQKYSGAKQKSNQDNDCWLLAPQEGDTRLFIQPGYKLKFVDSLITNFHLPKSSLLMLVTAFMSQPNCKLPYNGFSGSLAQLAYQEAVRKNYRFFSFGDAMWIQ